MYHWPRFLLALVALAAVCLPCLANPSPEALLTGSTTRLDKPGSQSERIAGETTDRGTGGRGGNASGGGGRRGGGGGGDGDDNDEDEYDGLTANRAEVTGLFARFMAGSDGNRAYHYFIIDEYDDDNPETADFVDWRTRQSVCAVGPGQQITTGSDQDRAIPCISMLEFDTLGGTLTHQTLQELDRRMLLVNQYSDNEYLQFIEYTMFVEYTSFASGRDFSFVVKSGNGATSNEIHVTVDEFDCVDMAYPTMKNCIWDPHSDSSRHIVPYEWIRGRFWRP